MSLTKDQLIQFVEKPGLLKEQTIGDLKEIIDEFPYFQTAQLLYTYNLFTRDNFRYQAYLKNCSIYANDRTVLYKLLQPKTISEQAPKQPVQRIAAGTPGQENSELFEFSDGKQITDTEFSIYNQAASSETEMIDFDLLSFEQQDALFQLDESETSSDSGFNPVQSKTVIPKPAEKVDLIEQFIKVNPTIQPRNEISHTQNDLFELNDSIDGENDEFITETLSRIYLKQGHYQKAIESFKRLSLKFPEKSAYFAEQIEEIKKLIN